MKRGLLILATVALMLPPAVLLAQQSPTTPEVKKTAKADEAAKPSGDGAGTSPPAPVERRVSGTSAPHGSSAITADAGAGRSRTGARMTVTTAFRPYFVNW